MTPKKRIEIAASVLSGLLASGHYTVIESDGCVNLRTLDGEYEAVEDALNLTDKLIAKAGQDA
jgi:hypothetical protein